MLPQQFLDKMEGLLGTEYPDFLEAFHRPRNAGLRLHPKKGKDTVLPFCAEPIPWGQQAYYLREGSRPGLHPYHDAGVYYLQEASAMAPAALLAPEPGERVLDLCAAPGGKSTQLAAAMEGRGLLVCNEIHPKRARILSSNIERMGVENALVLNEHPAKLAAHFPGYFDRIMVDAPCSGEGMFRKEESALSDWSPETVAMCAARQGEILSSAAEMLRPGGRLVYSTCTFSPEENEGVIRQFLRTHRDFFLIAPELPYFDRGRPEWVSGGAELEACVRLWPHKLRGEGHFAAVLQREGEASEPLGREADRKPLPGEIRAFFRENGLEREGSCLAFGETYFLVPPELPELRGLKVLRAGLELGELRKGRFLPAHALALACDRWAATLDLDPEGPELAAYLRGETLPVAQQGWILVTVSGRSLGWGKGAGGVLKNHYPKGLRRG